MSDHPGSPDAVAEQVIAIRKAPSGHGQQYEIKWQGQEATTWEAVSRMRRHIPELIRAFEEVQQQKMQPENKEGASDEGGVKTAGSLGKEVIAADGSSMRSQMEAMQQSAAAVARGAHLLSLCWRLLLRHSLSHLQLRCRCEGVTREGRGCELLLRDKTLRSRMIQHAGLNRLGILLLLLWLMRLLTHHQSRLHVFYLARIYRLLGLLLLRSEHRDFLELLRLLRLLRRKARLLQRHTLRR
jgi:hypothetical protein